MYFFIRLLIQFLDCTLAHKREKYKKEKKPMSQEQLKEFAKKYDGRVAKLLSLGRDRLLEVDGYSYIKEFGFTEDDVKQLLMLA